MNDTATTNPSYPPPHPALIEDIRRRLSEIPCKLAEYIHEALQRESIEHVANYTYKAGHLFAPGDLYEYRKTLFPPNSLLDPYTAGPPSLRPEFTKEDAPPTPEPAPEMTDAKPPLNETRRHLIQLLHQRTDAITVAPPQPTDSSAVVNSVPSVAVGINPSVLLTDLRDVINRYVVLPGMAAEALALWVVHTYAFTLRQVTTYIGVVSPEKRCGKTTLLELLGSLAHEAVAAANISPSALFRVIEEDQPTLIIDEADTFLQGRDEMAGILNAGYRKGNSYVVRVSDGKERRKPAAASSKAGSQLVKFSCWCPKVMAAIGRLPDTLADRCIVITMQRKMSGEKCERLRDLDPAPYRQRCADFVEHCRDAIATARPDIPSGLNDRAADIWEPLLAIADLAGGDWPELARRAAVKLSGSVDDEMTPIAYFLKDIRTLMLNSKVDRILSRDIIRVLNPMHGRPWEDLRRGRDINEYWLGHRMRELGIRSRNIRVGEAVHKGYLLEEVAAALKRYIPELERAAAE